MMKAWYFLICFLGLKYKILKRRSFFTARLNKILMVSNTYLLRISRITVCLGGGPKCLFCLVTFSRVHIFVTCSCTRLLTFRDKFRTASELLEHFFACWKIFPFNNHGQNWSGIRKACQILTFYVLYENIPANLFNEIIKIYLPRFSRPADWS